MSHLLCLAKVVRGVEYGVSCLVSYLSMEQDTRDKLAMDNRVLTNILASTYSNECGVFW